MASGVILLHPLQGVDTMLVTRDFTGEPVICIFSNLYMILYVCDRLFIFYTPFMD
jgi:hypothetical protein